MIAGKLIRTYYFPVTAEQLKTNLGTFSNSTRYNNWDALRYNLMTWAEVTQNDAYRYLWTGAANFLTITDLPEIQSKIFGFDKYTLIRLDWLGMFRLFALGEYANQSRCLIDDCADYAFYKPISVTVEFIPKYRRPPGKTTHVVPSLLTLPKIDLFQGTSAASVPGIIFFRSLAIFRLDWNSIIRWFRNSAN